jgi:hypothetical protein
MLTDAQIIELANQITRNVSATHTLKRNAEGQSIGRRAEFLEEATRTDIRTVELCEGVRRCLRPTTPSW